MTDQHRATPEQWEAAENEATDGPSGRIDSCLIELRARVEVLEKGQPQAWEAPPGIEPLLPRSQLATRITDAVKREPYGTAGVRAVIYAVAGWLAERRQKANDEEPTHWDPPSADDAIRWLREEAGK